MQSPTIIKVLLVLGVIFLSFSLLEIILGVLSYMDSSFMSELVVLGGLEMIVYGCVGVGYSLPVSYYLYIAQRPKNT